MSIVELRQYIHHPGTRDILIGLFEEIFLEAQRALGMEIPASFRDAEAKDRFVWLRSFPDLESRTAALTAFYSGPVWRRHRDAQESDELLRRAVAPRAHEVGADERPRLVRAAQIGHVAADAVREIRRPAGGGLGVRERPRLRVRGAGQREQAGDDCASGAAGAPHGINQPQRLPSGAVSLWICR